MTIFTHKFRLKDVTEIQVGFPFKSAEYSDTGIKLLRGDNIGQGFLQWNGVKFWPIEKSSHLSQYILQKDDVVIAMDRPWISSGLKYSVIHHENDRTLLVQRVARLRSLPNIHKYILPYIIGSRNFTNYVLSVQTGTTIPHISLDQIGDYEFFAPPIKEQEKIGSLLRRLDDKIDLNRRTNETLEAMARALFRDWFVDFGPTRAKMAGKAPYLAPELWELFPDRLDDEEKPEGWKITRIGDCIERLKVGTLYSQKDLELSGTVPVLDQGKNGIIGYHNNAPNIVATPNERVCTFANHTCTQKLIDFPFSTIQNVIPFKGKKFSSEWIFFATLGKQNFQEYKGHWPDFIEQTICTPDKSDVVNFYRNMIDPMLNKQSENTREIETLTQLRDLLLPKLMSGEISIRNAEKMVEDAA